MALKPGLNMIGMSHSFLLASKPFNNVTPILIGSFELMCYFSQFIYSVILQWCKQNLIPSIFYCMKIVSNVLR